MPLDNYITFLSNYVHHRITKRGLFVCKPHSSLITHLALICSLARNLCVRVFCKHFRQLDIPIHSETIGQLGH